MSKEQTFSQSQLDKYEKMQEASEKVKAFENGLAIATTLTKAMIESGHVVNVDSNSVTQVLEQLLDKSSSLVESKLRALRLETEEAVMTPDIAQPAQTPNA